MKSTQKSPLTIAVGAHANPENDVYAKQVGDLTSFTMYGKFTSLFCLEAIARMAAEVHNTGREGLKKVFGPNPPVDPDLWFNIAAELKGKLERLMGARDAKPKVRVIVEIGPTGKPVKIHSNDPDLEVSVLVVEGDGRRRRDPELTAEAAALPVQYPLE